jgi:AcrR family transcriptional regulator
MTSLYITRRCIIVNVPPQPRDPETPTKLVAAAARLLAGEGRGALTARRLGAEVGASSMAVYTYFGGMDELLKAVWRHGFLEFAGALSTVRRTSDPVADLMANALAYRSFARANPDLYRVMFGVDTGISIDDPQDQAQSLSTFATLVHAVERCAALGRWSIADASATSQMIWACLHGHCMLELAFGNDGPFELDGAFRELFLRLSVGHGDTEADTRRSLRSATRRRAAFPS